MTDHPDPLLLHRDGPIARLVLNRPDKHNAITLEMWRALPRLVAAVEADPDVKAVIVCGAGGRAFSAGADISEFAEVYATPESSRAYNEAVRAGFHAVERLSRPVIASIGGICVGGGCGLALACDLRFAAEGSRFGITPAKLGLVYGYADTRRLVETVGPARAKDILFSGRLVEAEEALRIGLVDRVVPQDRLEAETLAYVADLSERSQYTIRASKRMVQDIMDGFDTETPASRALFEAGFEGPDFREGYGAFVAKRRPRFTWG
ncbi:enoyl-CoA hydratase-related protein [Rhodocista pekingensis]|uniref:Enoyl-CoA hydratase-related protein n=1 Tax=Rhodocista pekingensis TaxID=201185 RepID=A0ABW2KRL3_9PROT